MTDEEKKAWEECVKQCEFEKGFYPVTVSEGSNAAILAADAELTALRAEVGRLEEEINEGDLWMVRASESLRNGACPVCFCTDEGPHKIGCLWWEMEHRLSLAEKVVELYRLKTPTIYTHMVEDALRALDAGKEG